MQREKKDIFKITQLKARSDGEPIMMGKPICKNGRKNNSNVLPVWGNSVLGKVKNS